MESQGVGAAAIVQAYIDFFLQLPPRNTNGFISGTRGLMDKIRGYLDDVKMIEYIAGVKESNAAFRDYIIQLGNSREAFNTVRNMADTKAVVVILQRYHIDTDYIVSLIQLLFGWQ